MTNPFTSGFLTTLGKMIALIVMILFILFLVYLGFKAYDKYIKPQPNNPKPGNDIVINKPEYKPGKVISTANTNEMKVNHEKLSALISNNDALIAEYYSK